MYDITTYWFIIYWCANSLPYNKFIFYLQLISLANNIEATAKAGICSWNRKELRTTVYLPLPFTRNNHLATLMHYLIDKTRFIISSNRRCKCDETFINYLVAHTYLSYSFSENRRMAVHNFFLSCFFIAILGESFFFRKEHVPW